MYYDTPRDFIAVCTSSCSTDRSATRLGDHRPQRDDRSATRETLQRLRRPLVSAFQNVVESAERSATT